MKVIPAIDLKDGRCVRLYKGDFSKETVYSDDPPKVALHWQQAGAPMLHIVDLDGAKDGQPRHTGLIGEICRTIDIPVQVGGGIRSRVAIESMLDAGVSRVVLGTVALEDPGLLAEALQAWGNQIAVSLDARDGMLATRGWLGATERLATAAAAEFASAGVRCLIYTDISRDGTLQGPDLGGTRAIQQAAGRGVNVIASGGVRSVDDLLKLQECGVAGAIVGKALYDGRIHPGVFLSLLGGDQVADS